MKLKTLLLTLCLPALLHIGTTLAAEPVRVAIDPTFPPMEYIQDGKRTGFDIDMASALAEKLGRPLEYTDMDFKAMVPSVLAGRSDIILSAIYITDERKKVVDFTDPYFSAGLVVMVNKDNTSIKGPADLAGKRVAVQVGTKSVSVMNAQYPTARLIEVEKNEEMFNSLTSGRADAVVTGKPAALLYAKARGVSKVLDEPLTREDYGIAVSKREPELRAELNKALQAIRADGSWQRIHEKWFGVAGN
ncbi:transporter substrate-binding domain-containing protein [Erwiniaceae bacterium BAC15a-03b]|uniref:Transporter substrate-binding domain-containing protein n=1 Tax=Winslowiella arboricola TaxID=2978220 RepID=A0A9J6PLA7_9GAMM|nr:transporter substrate-binding domain-containing protein [Winslowiella arboricola]MCU5771651.1 transporter substrate-binding domain-containing protein [Winslowiella arboricola]MCU5776464.1 transporter substrate-binding domain-containing protein [Winslowiella arboricola]